MMKKKQVNKEHYNFTKYMHQRRWASILHQLDEVSNCSPESVLELGPGAGIFKATAKAVGINVESVDIDPELEPDHVASATDLPLVSMVLVAVCEKPLNCCGLAL